MEFFEISVLVISFLALLIIGVPIAYSIGISVVLTMLVSIPPEAAFTTLAQRIATGLDSFALLAIPFFVLAGQLMNRGGIAERLINFAKGLLGSLPGGLAYVNILASMLFGAISGSAAAAASAIGGIMNPRMVKEGYSKSFSASINITAATTGLIIPPSNILIVYSLASGGVSISALFLAGYIPGTLLGLALMIVAGVVSYRNKYAVGERTPFKVVIKQFFDALPSLFLLIVVIGGIVAGVFTATEASAIAVLYTLILSMGVYKQVKVKDLPDILINTVSMTAIIMLLIGTSMGMSWVMSYANIPQQVSATLLSLSDNIFVILIIINFILLFVGIFMDMTPAVLIFTPIFLPVVMEMGVDPVHFGIVMVLNLCIGLCTPPVGSVLFIGCSVAGISISKVIKPLIPLFIVMIIVLMIVTFIPQLSLWLPSVFGL
ncbi:TRAP transporter large permease [Fulvivirga lutimaris]|uniref:TRAP transporter large permease n=1 Tax=Fulvivirga lutimaris TaxID=1819566 RepID=UPI0012BCD617|nr:TRAP transporter large permease [Fulvivirga lutimaris]MTI39197.1 TRAP transporter large permease [Fulvivirga lutimaris]